MAKRKTKGKSDWSQLASLVRRPLVWRLALAAIIVALLLWQWSTLAAWASSTWEALGWGLLLIDIFLITLTVTIWRWELVPIRHHWNKWLGG